VGLFEPVVMFFGMTNLPATFQAMMNKILRDMINKGKVAAFVDDVLVGTEMEEGHDKVVEKVLRRLEENNLYVKPEKCMWKIQKVPFLGVVIGEGCHSCARTSGSVLYSLPLHQKGNVNKATW